MTPNHITAIDLSLRSTGVANLSRGGVPDLRVVTSEGKRADPWYVRCMRLEALEEQILALVPDRAYVIVEGPSYGSGGVGSMWDRAGLFHRVLGELLRRRHAVAVAQPTTVKKWATGSGTADKAAVASAVTRLLPDDVELITSDVSDAAVMSLMAAQYLGWLEFSKARATSLQSVQWPEAILGERAA